MRTASMLTVNRKARVSAQPKARRGVKGLLAHLREQSVSFPSVRRHPLPAK
jgi:hypothetical protein